MNYQGVEFEHKGRSCKLAGRHVTGTEAKTKAESIIKMVDIIDELTGIEKREMKPGDLLKTESGQLGVILDLDDGNIYFCVDLFNIERKPAVFKWDTDQEVCISIDIAKEIGGSTQHVKRKKKYKHAGYEDVWMHTGKYSTQKLVSVWT